MPQIDTFFTTVGKPNKKVSVGLVVDGEVRAHCIGSGENFREAKACALKHVRTVLKKVVAMKEGK